MRMICCRDHIRNSPTHRASGKNRQSEAASVGGRRHPPSLLQRGALTTRSDRSHSLCDGQGISGFIDAEANQGLVRHDDAAVQV